MMRAVRTNMHSAFQLNLNTEHDVKTWQQLPKMKNGRATHGCTSSVYKVSLCCAISNHLLPLQNKFQDNTPVVIVAGGMDFNQRPISSVEVLILDMNPRWFSLGDLIKPRSWYPGIAILGNRLIVASGKVLFG